MNPISQRQQEEDRLMSLGIYAPKPLNYVPPVLLAEIAQLLMQVTRNPYTAISKGQFKEAAEQSYAKMHVMASRLDRLDEVLGKFKLQIDALPEGDQMRLAFDQMYATLNIIIQGQ